MKSKLALALEPSEPVAQRSGRQSQSFPYDRKVNARNKRGKGEPGSSETVSASRSSSSPAMIPSVNSV